MLEKTNKKLHILVANDDGIDAPGIYALAERLQKDYHITMVAPSMQEVLVPILSLFLTI